MNLQPSHADPQLLVLCLCAAAGLVVGCGYFAALRRGVGLIVARGAAVWSVLWVLVRVGGAALFFALVVRWGAMPLLAAFLGFLAARHLAVRTARSVE